MPQTSDRISAARRRKAALAHPTRARIVEYLGAHATASPVEIARSTGAPLSTISYHVRKLVAVDAIRLVAQHQVRGAVEHRYALAPTAMRRENARLLAHETPHERAHGILDATAVADLGVDLRRLFARIKELEAQTLNRAAAEPGYHVTVSFDADALIDATSRSAIRHAGPLRRAP